MGNESCTGMTWFTLKSRQNNGVGIGRAMPERGDSFGFKKGHQKNRAGIEGKKVRKEATGKIEPEKKEQQIAVTPGRKE